MLRSLRAGLAGAVVGGVLYGLTRVADDWRLIPFAAALGALLPLLGGPVLGAFRSVLAPLGIDSVPLTLPGLGEVTLELGNPQREAARRIFFEMTTRTVTQPLPQEEGSLRAAIQSLSDFFQVVRDEIKDMAPTRPGSQGTQTLESIAHAMLNEAVRPYLTRWHLPLERWEATGLPESAWPLADVLRRDLDRMRSLAIGYASSLGRAAQIPQVDRLLPAAPSASTTSSALPPADQSRIDTFERSAAGRMTELQRQAAWALSVELRAVGRLLPGLDDAARREELRALLGFVGERVRETDPTPPGDSVATIGLPLIDTIAGALAAGGSLDSLGETLGESATQLAGLARGQPS